MYVSGKMRPVETIPGMGEDKGELWRIQLWYIVRTFVNVTMYPQYNKNKNKFKKLKRRKEGTYQK
jgi:hypothetical protein